MSYSFVTPWTAAHQGPLSMEFSRQEYCSGLPCPSPGDLPGPGIKPASPAFPALAEGFFTTEPTGTPTSLYLSLIRMSHELKMLISKISEYIMKSESSTLPDMTASTGNPSFLKVA